LEFIQLFNYVYTTEANVNVKLALDYEGYMGVPITFLHKFNPDQFELIKFRKGNNGKDLSINGKCPYFRIIIRNKRINKSTQKNCITYQELFLFD